MSNRRIERVSKLVQQQLGEIIQQLNLMNCGFVTVTSAEVSPDLKDARVYIGVIGKPEQKHNAIAALTAEHSRIQHELSRRIILKYTPRLRFLLDETESHAQHIEHLLDELAPKPTDEPEE
jgi:ribosome-binding factor A